MPSSAARSFIRCTKVRSEPASFSAIATAQSLAEATAMHLIISSTVRLSPSSSQIWLPPMEAAALLAVTLSSIEIVPASTASAISSSVMIFVTLAGER